MLLRTPHIPTAKKGIASGNQQIYSPGVRNWILAFILFQLRAKLFFSREFTTLPHKGLSSGEAVKGSELPPNERLVGVEKPKPGFPSEFNL